MRAVTAAILGTGVVGTLAIGAAAFYVAGSGARGPDPLGAISVCEQTLLQELQAPASYKRVSARFDVFPPLTYPDYLAYRLSGNCADGFSVKICGDVAQMSLSGVVETKSLQKRLGIKLTTKNMYKGRDQVLAFEYELGKRKPLAAKQTGGVEIVYDAVNAFNAPLRETKVCRFGPLRGEKYTAEDMFDPTIDVNDMTGWSLTEAKVDGPALHQPQKEKGGGTAQ